ncbi:cytochrome P450 [Mycena polygramma]|nr:cytochrome P450 [Mycena polygramma]KAJ7670779.1 cytochrome P450 [Mycena polygramma]
MRPLFAPLGLFGAIIPTCWWNPGLDWIWQWRKTTFFNYKYDVISLVPLLVGDPCYYSSSPDVLKQLLNNEGKTHLVKPRWLTSPLLLWGDNLVSANGEMWKRHRRLMAPAFTTNTYSMVIAETIAIYKEMTAAEGWDGQDNVAVTDNHILHKLTLIIIARCGFGIRMPWSDIQGASGELSFGDALAQVTKTSILRLVLPKWAYKLGIKKFDTMNRAWNGLAAFMHDFVATRQEELNGMTEEEGQRGDIFSRLVAAMNATGKLGLEEQEVIGNTFTLLFAGHESTACVLAATLGYLAIYQDEQQKAYEEIMNTIPATRDPNLDDLSKLPHLLACFHESLRMYPAPVMLTREMTEDVPINVARPVEKTMILKKGSLMVIELVGVQHNPHFFPEPEVYKPSRWYGVPESEIPLFGMGPRVCIGKKFSHTEGLCFLSLLLRDWKLDIPLSEGETRSEYEKRVMGHASRVGMAFGCGPMSLRLSRRK